MAAYRVQVAPSALRDLEKLDRPVRRRLWQRIEALEQNPRPPDSAKLRRPAPYWRIRIGPYRVIYTIRDRDLLVLVVRVGDRKDIYRKPLQ
jgi:mRNA interferase RelE/StbE